MKTDRVSVINPRLTPVVAANSSVSAEVEDVAGCPGSALSLFEAVVVGVGLLSAAFAVSVGSLGD